MRGIEKCASFDTHFDGIGLIQACRLRRACLGRLRFAHAIQILLNKCRWCCGSPRSLWTQRERVRGQWVRCNVLGPDLERSTSRKSTTESVSRDSTQYKQFWMTVVNDSVFVIHRDGWSSAEEFVVEDDRRVWHRDAGRGNTLPRGDYCCRPV